MPEEIKVSKAEVILAIAELAAKRLGVDKVIILAHDRETKLVAIQTLGCCPLDTFELLKEAIGQVKASIEAQLAQEIQDPRMN